MRASIVTAAAVSFWVGLASASGAATPPSAAQTAPAAATASDAVARGRETFHRACAVCHGDRGNGKGPTSAALTPRPTDLTKLARRAGSFPRAHVEASIRGTDPVVAHGNQTMLVWGAMFLAETNGDQAAADARIADLVAFIESIQVR